MNKLDIVRNKNGAIIKLQFFPDTIMSLRRAQTIDEARESTSKSHVYFDPEPLVVQDLLKMFPDMKVSDDLAAWYHSHQQKIEQLQKIKEKEFGEDPESDLFPYQEQGVIWLREAKRGILGDEPGLGKTVQGIIAADEVKAKNILILCPGYVVKSWGRHIQEWLGEKPILAMGNAKAKTEALQRIGRFYVANHEMARIAPIYDPADLKKKKKIGEKVAFPELFRRKWDVIIIDEAHRIKSRKAQWSEGAQRLKSEYLWELTGTPIWNKPDDLWMLLNLLDPERFSSYWKFVDRFCVTELSNYGKHIIGPDENKIPRLQTILDGMLISRKKVEVLKDLPEKQFIDITYDLSKEQARIYKEMADKFRLEKVDETKFYSNVVSMLSDMRMICNAPYLIGVDAPSSKDDVILDLIDDVALDRNFIIFTWHQKYANHLYELLKSRDIPAEVVHSGIKEDKRSSAVESFQAGNLQGLVGTIGTIGTGRNLQEHCALSFFMEHSWTPIENVQAEDRTHRIGQKSTPQYYRVFARGTIEEHVIEVTRHKAYITDKILAIQEVMTLAGIPAMNIIDR